MQEQENSLQNQNSFLEMSAFVLENYNIFKAYITFLSNWHLAEIKIRNSTDEQNLFKE